MIFSNIKRTAIPGTFPENLVVIWSYIAITILFPVDVIAGTEISLLVLYVFPITLIALNSERKSLVIGAVTLAVTFQALTLVLYDDISIYSKVIVISMVTISDILVAYIARLLRETLLEKITIITELKHKKKQLSDLSAQLMTVQEKERSSLAREIHDDLGGTLFAQKMECARLAEELTVNEKTAPLLKHTESLGQLNDNAMNAIRRIINGLRPAMLDNFGLTAAIEYHAAQFHKSTGIECQLKCLLNKEDEKKLSGVQSNHLFLILQEALTNVAKHSHASRVAIEMCCSDEEITLSISDNGCGISQNHIASSNSYGMSGMNERTRLIGGAIEFDSLSGGGFSVTVSLPLADNP